MIIVTGGAGLIGSNIIAALNDMGRRDILVVDNLTDGTKFVNLVDLDIGGLIKKILLPLSLLVMILEILTHFSIGKSLFCYNRMVSAINKK